MDSIIKWAGVVALVILAILGIRSVQSPATFGSSANGGNVTNFTAVSVTDGYYVSDVLGFNGSAATFGLTTQGGGVTATSSTGTGTLTAANISVGLIEHTNAGAATLTFPASSTITSLIPTAGQSVRVTYANLGTGIDTLAGGSGTLLHVASSTIATGLKTVAASGSAILTFTRKSNSDIIIDMVPAQ